MLKSGCTHVCTRTHTHSRQEPWYNVYSTGALLHSRTRGRKKGSAAGVEINSEGITRGCPWKLAGLRKIISLHLTEEKNGDSQQGGWGPSNASFLAQISMPLLRTHCQLARGGTEGPGGGTQTPEGSTRRCQRALSCFPESKGSAGPFHSQAPPLGLSPGNGAKRRGQGLTWVKEPSSLHSGTNTASWGFLACSRACARSRRHLLWPASIRGDEERISYFTWIHAGPTGQNGRLALGMLSGKLCACG